MRVLWLLMIVFAGSIAGCGYVVGNGFSHDARTIHVPMFTSDTFRRNTSERLTEAVHKEIEQRTPYRLVTAGDQADTRLVGHITSVRKSVLLEDRHDDIREAQLAYEVQLRWEDMRTGQLLGSRNVPLSNNYAELTSAATMIPEIGQSYATAEQSVVDQMARDIVNLLEMPW